MRIVISRQPCCFCWGRGTEPTQCEQEIMDLSLYNALAGSIHYTSVLHRLTHRGLCDYKGLDQATIQLNNFSASWINSACHETLVHAENLQTSKTVTFSVCFKDLDPYLLPSDHSFSEIMCASLCSPLCVCSGHINGAIVMALDGCTVHKASLWLMDILINDESITIDCQQPACFRGLKLVIASTTDLFNHVWQTPLILRRA